MDTLENLLVDPADEAAEETKATHALVCKTHTITVYKLGDKAQATQWEWDTSREEIAVFGGDDFYRLRDDANYLIHDLKQKTGAKYTYAATSEHEYVTLKEAKYRNRCGYCKNQTETLA